MRLIILGKGNRNRTANKNVAVKTVKKEKNVGIIITAIVCAIALVCAISYAVWQKSDSHLDSLVSVEIGEHQVSPVEYRYYYWSNINDFYNDNYLYINYGLYNIDFSKSLSNQTCSIDKDKTWAEYFCEQTLDSLKEKYAIMDAAAAEGFVLSDEDKAEMEDSIKELRESVKKAGYSSLNKYTTTAFKTSEKNFLKYTEENTLISKYYKDKLDSFVYSDEEIQKYYEENKKSFDNVDYRYYLITYTTSEENSTSKDDAKARADAMAAAVTDSQSFADYVYDNLISSKDKENYDKSATLNEGSTYAGAMSATNTGVADWLFDDARNANDITVIDISGKGYAVVLFLDRSLDTYNMVTVRHILVKTTTVDKIYTTEEPTKVDTEATEKAQADSDAEKLAKAEEILAKFNAGQKTEDAFAALANEFSEDPGSNTTGGIYENIYKGMMLSEFNDWCFDENRKPGDCEIIKTTAGYHIMYFVGENEPYWSYTATNNLKKDAWTKIIDDGEAANTVVEHEDIIAKAIRG